MLDLGAVRALADPAIEVPEIDAFRQGLAALAFHVLAHVVLDRIDHTRGLQAGHFERERFLHDGLWRSYATLSMADLAGAAEADFPQWHRCRAKNKPPCYDAARKAKRFMNVTLKFPDDLYRKARQRAVDESKSLSHWLVELIERELARTYPEGKALIERLGDPATAERDFELPDRTTEAERRIEFP